MRVKLIVALVLGFPLTAQTLPNDPVIDKKFVLTHSYMLAGMFADQATTRRFLNGARCQESSPWYGKRPSIGRQVGISSAEAAGIIVVSYFFKKSLRNIPNGQKHYWMLFPLMDGSAHFLAAWSNYGARC